MRPHRTISSFALAVALLPGAALPGLASSSDWFEHEGGNIRIVITGAADANGALRGILQIDLQPGWHTYWRDPGETGVAPSIAVTPAAAPVEIGFPAPSRLEDGSAGYAAPVSLPLTIRPQAPGRLEARIFLGFCSEICIPVDATLAVDPAEHGDDPVDRGAVADAFAALPGQPRADFHLTAVVSKPLEITAAAALPPGTTGAELFMAGDAHYALGVPKRISEEDGKAVFRITMFPSSNSVHREASFRYVLKAGGKAVEGTVAIPGF